MNTNQDYRALLDWNCANDTLKYNLRTLALWITIRLLLYEKKCNFSIT